MKRTLRSLPALAATLALALGPLGAPGCAKKLTVDQLGALLVSYPQGRRDTLERTPSDLVVWPNVPILVTDSSAIGVIVYPANRTGAGVMQGVILDYLQAGGYQMFRREGAFVCDTEAQLVCPDIMVGGGYRQFSDFVLTPSRRWADRDYYGTTQGTVVLPPAQLYFFSDAAPAADTPLKGYFGRAVISGLSSADYPRTNLGEAPDTSAIAPLRYTGRTGQPGKPDAPPDSLLDMSWEAVPGAAGYWVHIYQKRVDIPEHQAYEEAIAIALPAPIALGKVRDLFVGYFPAPITSYKLGSVLPTGSRVLVYRVLLGGQEVFIRNSAVDARGRLIATTGTAGDVEFVNSEIEGGQRLRRFPLGARRVTPDSPKPPP